MSAAREGDSASERRAQAQFVEIEALARQAGVRVELVRRFVAHGLVEPEGAERTPLFRSEAALLVARAARLQRDLGLNVAGAVLACELIARIEQLEDQLRQLGLAADRYAEPATKAQLPEELGRALGQ